MGNKNQDQPAAIDGPEAPAGNQIEVKLSRDLGFFDVTMIGIAGMIGAGVFALTGIAAGIAGPALIVAFFLNGIVATLTAAAYAELGSAFPEAGGGYLWVKEALPGPFGFLSGWISWFAHSVACALYAVTFGAFTAEILVAAGLGYDRGLLMKLSAFAAVTFLTYINFKGVKETGKVGGGITLAKVAVLLIFIAFGVSQVFSIPDWLTNLSTPSFAPAGLVGIFAAMGLTYIAFEGFEIIVQSGEEVRDPEKNIPRAIFLSLWVAALIYILVAFSVLGAVQGPEGMPSWMYLGDLAEMGLIRVAGQIMPYGTAILLFAGLISTLSAMNATIYSSSRVSFAMARDRVLDRRLADIHPVNRTPHYSIFFSYIIIAFMAVSFPIEAVAASTDIMFILLFMLVNISLITLRYRTVNLKRTFRVPLVPYLPIAAILLQLVIGYFLLTELEHGGIALLSSVIWLFFGVLVYYSYSEKKEKEKIEEELKTVYEEKAFEEAAYRILVPVANPAVAGKLLGLARVIALAKNGEITLLSVIRLPEQTPLYAGKKYVEREKKFIKGLMDEVKDVPVSGTVILGHSVSEAILNTVRESRTDLIIMGWRGKTFRRDFILGSTIDPVILKAPCDVAIVRFETGFKIDTVEGILIPTAGGPHSDMAVELARDISKVLGAQVTMMHAARDKSRLKRAERYMEDAKKAAELDAGVLLVESGKAIDAIVRESLEHNMIIIGATNETFLKNFIKGPFPEKLVKQTSRTVVMVRKKIAIASFVRRWLVDLNNIKK